ncbi:uncharacterized protein [Glycine max]|uniref:uncharacterized protein n=1 Tax=Glycine max TaxID=3847 RepID=UPI0003DED6ED|nr:uncharacterized protein LOC102661423 [Glycine max]|eukprot:XP_006595324.1 uncharacterized protein LOC102661423 [Glycine max]
MLTKKNRYIHIDRIFMEGNCSAMIQRILPPKHKGPRVVTIPCCIGEVAVGKALIDLGASINLMPLSMCRRLGEIEIMPTCMTLQLADRSITRPYGMIEDVLIQVKQLIFPANFVVMDIEEDLDIPIILGRPFMSTTNCIVDMGKYKLELSMEDQKASFDLFEAINYPNDMKARFDLDKVEQEIETTATTMALHSPLEKALINHVECLTKEEEHEVQTCIKELEGAGEISERHSTFEELKNSGQIEKPNAELKTLPAHLKYVFLEDNDSKPVIISSLLKKIEEDQMVQILKRHKAAI